MLSVVKCSQSAWHNVCVEVNQAVVFIDNACAECLHWNGGASLLFNAGAHEIKEFSSFESGSPSQKKGVFLVSSPLHGVTAEIVRDILQASRFEYVIVISSLSPAMHNKIVFGTHEGENKAFHQFEDSMLHWMQNLNTAEVIYIPVVSAPITPGLFVLPSHSTLFPLLPSDMNTLIKMKAMQGDVTPSAADIDFTFFDRELQLAMKLLVCSLNSLLETLGVTEDCFALGHTSRIVATELACLQWAKNRRKTASLKASLLLVDRTLDVASCVGHHSDTLIDRILSLLPRLPGHHNDIQTNMLPLCGSYRCGDPSVVLPGCLSHQTDPTASSLLTSLVISKQKEALMDVNRNVVEAASTENLPLKLTGKPGRVTAEQLQAHLSLFSGKAKALRKHSGILQIGQATCETLKHEKLSRIDGLHAIEKGLLQCVGDPDSPTPLSQILHTLKSDLQKPAGKRRYTYEDILSLLVYVYSLAGPGDEFVPTSQDETTLQADLTDAILNDEEVPEIIQQIVERPNNPDVVFSRVQEIFQKLRGLRKAREDLTKFRNTYQPGSLTSQASHQPLLRDLLEQILNPQKPELPDIIHKATGFNLLKTGFGLFMNVGKPRPSDHPMLIVFVIGGVTAAEVRQVKEAVSAAKTNTQVIVGSTSLVNPSDVIWRMFCQDNLHPDSPS